MKGRVSLHLKWLCKLISINSWIFITYIYCILLYTNPYSRTKTMWKWQIHAGLNQISWNLINTSSIYLLIFFEHNSTTFIPFTIILLIIVLGVMWFVVNFNKITAHSKLNFSQTHNNYTVFYEISANLFEIVFLLTSS